MPTRVMVTGAGGAAAIAFLKAFAPGEAVLFAGDVEGQDAGLYLVPPSRRVLLPHADDADFAPRLLELCRRNFIDVLVPTRDAELLSLSLYRAAFERLGTRVAVAQPDSLSSCLDKAALMVACRSTGAVTRWSVLDRKNLAERVRFPMVVKPRRSGGACGVRLVRSESELVDVSRAGELIAQEYLPGEEYSVDVFAGTDGRALAAVPRARAARNGEAKGSLAVRTVHDSMLEQMAISVVEALRLTGVANVQLRRDTLGIPRLMDVNPRVSAGMSVTVAAGVRMPQMLLSSVLATSLRGARMPFRDVSVVPTWKEHLLDEEGIATRSESGPCEGPAPVSRARPGQVA